MRDCSGGGEGEMSMLGSGMLAAMGSDNLGWISVVTTEGRMEL